MNRQRGMSSLSLVLLLLLLGSLMLHGLNMQLSSHLWRVSSENQAVRDSAVLHSAMERARQQSWLATTALRCQPVDEPDVRSCVRIFKDNSALLIVVGANTALWQRGQVEGDRVQFLPHGWSDFCPLKEEALCLPP